MGKLVVLRDTFNSFMTKVYHIETSSSFYMIETSVMKEFRCCQTSISFFLSFCLSFFLSFFLSLFIYLFIYLLLGLWTPECLDPEQLDAWTLGL